MKRFWSKVDRRGPDDCWEWQASRNRLGYGYFWDAGKGRMVFAHRFAYELCVGALPPMPPGRCGSAGTLVLHSCDNPGCVNPRHLRRGIAADNVADRTERGRTARLFGRANPNARLTAAQVEEIRAAYTGRWGEQSRLGRKYGVSPTTIKRIACPP